MNRTAAPNTTAGSVTAAQAEMPGRPLWQVPFFFVGVLSLLSAWSLRHCEATGSNRFQVRELSEVRRQLSKPAANIDNVVALAEKVLEQPELLGDHLGEAHFLLGTALLRRPEPDYRAARTHLEEAKKRGVDTKDAPHLIFRLAKAWYYTGGDPQQVVTNLNSSIEQVEEQEKAEGYSLLTEANLRLPTPDVKAALAANERLRKDIAMVPESVLAPARVRGAELLLRLNHPEEARLALQHVGSAVPAIQTRAYELQGQSYQMDEKWTEAASFYEKALPGLSEGNPERPKVLYQLGLCYRKLTNLEEARRRWDECGKTTTNPDYSQAAIFSMVEIQLVDNKHHAEALQYLTQVVRDIKTPTDWHNAVIEVGQVRDAFEQCISKFSEAHEYDLAVKLTEPYECLAPPGRTSLLRAQIHAQWGRDCRKPPPAQPDATPVAPDEEKARDHLCQAGDNYARTAEVSADPAARADLLWEAILCYREAPNNAQAIVMLRSFAKAYPRDAKRISECWYLLGETYRLEKNDVEAEKAYQNCITSDVPNHFIYLAKHQVARYLIQRNQLDNAEELLEQSLKDLRLQPDAEPLEQTLFTLGEIAFRKHKYNAVVLKLAEAVFKDESRKNPMIVRAHYYLAESYYELATIENSNAQQGGDKLDPRTYQHYLEQYRMYMTKAGQVFDTLACMLEEQPEASNQFPDELKDKVKIEIPFKAADCSFFLGKYDEALKRYEALATKYEKTLDGLTALGGTVRCLASLHRDQDMMKRLQEIEKGLDVIQDPKTREAWQKWVKIASQRPAASGDPR